MSVTPKGHGHGLNTLRAQYLENSCRCYLQKIANYLIVFCDAERSAILATAWLLVCHFIAHRDRHYKTDVTKQKTLMSSEIVESWHVIHIIIIISNLHCSCTILLSIKLFHWLPIIVAITVSFTMDEEFSNASVANMTLQSNTTMSFEIRAPRGQPYACAVYLFVIAGIVQLIISAIGLVGKAR